MARLTDTQLVILSAASQREDRGVELPANVQGKAAGQVVAKLVRASLLEELINQSISSCSFLLTGNPCANRKTNQKNSGLSTKPSLKYAA